LSQLQLARKLRIEPDDIDAYETGTKRVSTNRLLRIARALSSAILFTPDPAYHAFIAFTLGGMVAGAVLTDSAYLPALIGFVAPTILPAILAFFARARPMSITMGILLAAFATVLGMVGHRTNQWIASNARRGIILEKDVAERKLAESELRRSNGTLPIIPMFTASCPAPGTGRCWIACNVLERNVFCLRIYVGWRRTIRSGTNLFSKLAAVSVEIYGART